MGSLYGAHTYKITGVKKDVMVCNTFALVRQTCSWFRVQFWPLHFERTHPVLDMGPFPGSSLGSTGSVCLVPGGVRESMAPEPEALDTLLENLGSFLWMGVLLPSGSLPPEVRLGLGGGREVRLALEIVLMPFYWIRRNSCAWVWVTR